MHHYLDIHLRPNPEFPAHQLMDTLYGKLHRQLVQMNVGTIGVGFPGYSESPITLGNSLRLIGPLTDLAKLMDSPWLTGLRDYTKVTPISPVPAEAKHRTLRRVQAKSNPERLMRRQMRRHGFTEAQVREKYDGARAEVLLLPFVTLASGSTDQSFKLFFKLGPIEAQVCPGSFNAYGLSPTATLPWF